MSEGRVGEFIGLQHKLCDVGEERSLAKIDLFAGDGREKLRQDAINVGGSF